MTAPTPQFLRNASTNLALEEVGHNGRGFVAKYFVEGNLDVLGLPRA